jgi:hypothetical protein
MSIEGTKNSINLTNFMGKKAKTATSATEISGNVRSSGTNSPPVNEKKCN